MNTYDKLEGAIAYYREHKGKEPQYIMTSRKTFEEIKKFAGYNAKTKKYKGIKVQIGD